MARRYTRKVEDKVKTLSARVSKELDQAIYQAAVEEGSSVSHLIEAILAMEMEKRQKYKRPDRAIPVFGVEVLSGEP